MSEKEQAVGLSIKSHYETRDMTLAATLLCHEVTEDELVCVDVEKRKFAFRYTRTPVLMDVVDRYYSRNIQVNPQDLMKNVRILKMKMESSSVLG